MLSFFPAVVSWLAASAPRRAPTPLMESSVDQAFAAQGGKLDAKDKLMAGLKRECTQLLPCTNEKKSFAPPP